MTFDSALSFLRRRWLPLLLCVVAGIAGAMVHIKTSDKVYKSTARLFVNIPAAQSTQEALQGVQLSSQLIQSYADIVTSRSTADEVRQRLDLNESPERIASQLSATPAPNTLIIAISATDRDPARARSLAQAAAVVLNDAVSRLEHDRTPTSAVEASIIDNATTPTSPVSPRPVRDLVLGLVLGLLVGLGGALVVDALDRSVKIPAEVERLASAPSLAVVPRIRTKSRLVGDESTPSPAAEAYRALRTSLQFIDPDDPIRTLVITSPQAEDGKSTTAANLALAIASSGARVVLVDADLRQAGLSELLGVEGSVGLTSVLSGAVTLDAALQTYRPSLELLSAGTIPPNPSELLGSQRMTRLIEGLLERCDLVIFDAPPVLPVTDAVVLSTQVDGTALVVRHGRTTRGHVAEAARRLHAVDADLVGFVLNGRPRPEANAYYEAREPARRVTPVETP